MKKILLFLILFANILSAQTFLHGTTGIQGERVTNCLVSTCSGTYLDNGGAGANYSNNITGGLYRVFCPNLPGNCVSATFTSFRTEAGRDFLTVGNGATQNSPVFTNAPATVPFGRISGAPAVPFTYTANNPSGCLTFRFTSDGSITFSGWSATLTCVPCATPTNGPNTTDNNDCTRASELCSGVTYSSNSRGPGLVAEGCTGSTCPAGGENHTNWYFFTVLTTGTLTFTIDPQTNTDDYDFSVYGPNVTCNSLGTPIRCSDSGNTGNTGLNTTEIDNIENVLGNGFVNQMNVVAGEVYYMVVDEWLSNTGNGYDLTFGGTATLDCILFPIKLNYFGAEYRKTEKDALITWGAESDFGNEYFIVEKSQDGISFDSIGLVDVIGTGRYDYDFIDKYPSYDGLTYYRLKWLDEQLYRYSDVTAIAVEDVIDQEIIVQPNPFMDFISVRSFGYYYGDCDVEIYNMSGQKVLEQNLQFGVANKLEIDTKNLSKGFYTVIIKTQNFTKSFKMSK
jgi:hypothetical protein